MSSQKENLNLTGSVTSRIGFRSVNDCYDAARAFIESNWDLLKKYFDLEMEDSKPSIPTFHPTPRRK